METNSENNDLQSSERKSIPVKSTIIGLLIVVGVVAFVFFECIISTPSLHSKKAKKISDKGRVEVSVGDIVSFDYIDSADSSIKENSNEWIVLSVEDNRALVIKTEPYEEKRVRYDTAVRMRLEKDFLGPYFNCLYESLDTNRIQQINDETIFLLSWSELLEYVDSDNQPVFSPEDYTRFFVDSHSILYFSPVMWIFTDSIEERYERAISLSEAGFVEEAYDMFSSMKGYKESNDYCKKLSVDVREKRYNQTLDDIKNGTVDINVAKIGDVILLGRYIQYNEFGVLPIRWIVLDEKDGNLLVLCEKALALLPYHNERLNDSSHIIWKNSTIRQFLKDDFSHQAFNTDEVSIIQDTPVITNDYFGDGSYDAVETTDKLFLLSFEEVQKYIDSINLSCEPSEYACKKLIKPMQYCDWWLRTTMHNTGSHYIDERNGAYYIDESNGMDYNPSLNVVTWDGCHFEAGSNIYFDPYAVRPAMWISRE